MDASFVTIEPDTKVWARKDLTIPERQALRRKKVIEYILSRPSGEVITLPEFQAVCGHKVFQQADVLIKQMLDEGLISRELVPGKYNRFCYSVPGVQNGPVKVKTLPTTKIDLKQLTELAMRFSWENRDDHNDLRKFMTWLAEYTKGDKQKR